MMLRTTTGRIYDSANVIDPHNDRIRFLEVTFEKCIVIDLEAVTSGNCILEFAQNPFAF